MTLIVMAGLPGTGKTTLAHAVKQSLDARIDGSSQDNPPVTTLILNKDDVRAALFPPELIDYSAEQDDLCMDIVLRVATFLLRKNPHGIIFLDGRTFSKHYQVQAVEEAISDMDVKVCWIECICDHRIVKQRLIRDLDQGTHPAVNRGPGLYEIVRTTAEPLAVRRLIVDTSQPLQQCVAEVRNYVLNAVWVKNRRSTHINGVEYG